MKTDKIVIAIAVTIAVIGIIFVVRQLTSINKVINETK